MHAEIEYESERQMTRSSELADSTMRGQNLQRFHSAFPSFAQISLEVAEQAEMSGISDASLAYRAANQRGDRAYEQAHHYLGLALSPLGFRGEEVTCQLRLRHDDGYRILIARGGHVAGDTFRVNPKRRLTKKLIAENATALDYGRTLFSEHDEADAGTILNLWMLIDPHEQERISVYLLCPVSINDKGTLIRSQEWDYLGSMPLSVGAVLDDIGTAPVQTVDFDVEIRKASEQ